MIKYFCDICGKELEGEKYDKNRYFFLSAYNMMLCSDCETDLNNKDAELKKQFEEHIENKKVKK